MRPTLLLDLDGTLVDSVPDLTASANRVMVSRGLAPFTQAEVIPMVGDGAGALVRKLLEARGVEAQNGDLEAFLADYTAHPATQTRPFEGVPETLRNLSGQGWVLAVCTNKPETAARKLLQSLGLLDLLAAVGGGDSFGTCKPDPAHVTATLDAAGGDPGAAVMVGDHHNDVRAARGARVPCIFAAWGYGPLSMAEGAAAIADRFGDVPRLAAGLLATAAP